MLEVCQIKTLGETIRSLRKENNMTLEALAGPNLSKGMLSLIENNKANPSMESLNYIAGRLGIEVADLLDNGSMKELQSLLEKAERLVHVGFMEEKKEHQEELELIGPYLDKLVSGYEAARLLEIYSISLFRVQDQGWEEYADRAAALYDSMNMSSKRTDIAVFRSDVAFIHHQYERALEILLEERKELEARYAYFEPLSRIDLDYYESILHYAVGNFERAHEVMEQAIAYSKEQRIFYRIDDLYRIAAAHASIEENEEKLEYYLKKLKEYGKFTDDDFALVFSDLILIEALVEKEEYEEALERLDALQKNEDNKILNRYFALGRGKALYHLGHPAEALEYLQQVDIPDYLHHPFDLSTLYTSFSYQALCKLELGEMDDAFRLAELALEKVNEFPFAPYHQFIQKTAEEVRSACGNKKSNSSQKK